MFIDFDRWLIKFFAVSFPFDCVVRTEFLWCLPFHLTVQCCYPPFERYTCKKFHPINTETMNGGKAKRAGEIFNRACV